MWKTYGRYSQAFTVNEVECSWSFFKLDYCNPVASHLCLSSLFFFFLMRMLSSTDDERRLAQKYDQRSGMEQKGEEEKPGWMTEDTHTHKHHSCHPSNKRAAPQISARINLAFLLFNIHGKERVSERTTGTSPQLHFCPFQHQNRMISVADVKVWWSVDLSRDSYADLLPIRRPGRALCLIAALYCLLCTLEQTARRYRGAEI